MSTSEQAGQARSPEADTSRLPVGQALRAQREQLGWSLPDVAAWLRIRLSYLEALESGQVGKLPGSAYALGFLRAYAGALGLDPEDMSRRFRGETKDVNRKPELSFPAPVPERGVPAGAIVLLGVLVVAGAYIGWYEFTGHERRQVHTVPPVPQALLPYADTPAAPSPQVATVMPGSGQTPFPPPAAPAVVPRPAAPATAPSGSTAPVAVPAPTSVPDAAPPPQPVTPVPVPASAAPSMPTSAAPAIPASPGVASPGTTPVAPAAVTPSAVPGQITLKAVAASWVQVRQVGGKVIYDHVLQPGETWTVPPDAGAVTLTTGNAGGLTLAVDGIVTPPLGRVGGIRRAVPLSAQAIHDGSIATAAAPDPVAAHPLRPAHAAAPAARAPVHADDSADDLNARQLKATTPH